MIGRALVLVDITTFCFQPNRILIPYHVSLFFLEPISREAFYLSGSDFLLPLLATAKFHVEESGKNRSLVIFAAMKMLELYLKDGRSFSR